MLQFLWLVKMPVCLLTSPNFYNPLAELIFHPFFFFFCLNQFRPLSQVTQRSNSSREESKEGAEYALQLQY